MTRQAFTAESTPRYEGTIPGPASIPSTRTLPERRQSHASVPSFRTLACATTQGGKSEANRCAPAGTPTRTKARLLSIANVVSSSTKPRKHDLPALVCTKNPQASAIAQMETPRPTQKSRSFPTSSVPIPSPPATTILTSTSAFPGCFQRRFPADVQASATPAHARGSFRWIRRGESLLGSSSPHRVLLVPSFHFGCVGHMRWLHLAGRPPSWSSIGVL